MQKSNVYEVSSGKVNSQPITGTGPSSCRGIPAPLWHHPQCMFPYCHPPLAPVQTSTREISSILIENMKYLSTLSEGIIEEGDVWAELNCFVLETNQKIYRYQKILFCFGDGSKNYSFHRSIC